jgi:hypothetical protein
MKYTVWYIVAGETYQRLFVSGVSMSQALTIMDELSLTFKVADTWMESE